MNTIRLFSIILFCSVFSTASIAQKQKSEQIKVSGNCGMCKSKIEKAAKSAGASFAEWNVDTKVLSVKYDSKSVNAAKIQEAVAASGYDTQDMKASDEAYEKLHSCCKYERTASEKTMDCCKDGKCTMPGHDGKDCCKNTDQKMNCCKEGKCTMPGHSGKDCCKKS